MGYLATKPTMIITTLHASGVVNAGVFGAYTNLSSTQVGVAIARDSHAHLASCGAVQSPQPRAANRSMLPPDVLSLPRLNGEGCQ